MNYITAAWRKRAKKWGDVLLDEDNELSRNVSCRSVMFVYCSFCRWTMIRPWPAKESIYRTTSSFSIGCWDAEHMPRQVHACTLALVLCRATGLSGTATSPLPTMMPWLWPSGHPRCAKSVSPGESCQERDSRRRNGEIRRETGVSCIFRSSNTRMRIIKARTSYTRATLTS